MPEPQSAPAGSGQNSNNPPPSQGNHLFLAVLFLLFCLAALLLVLLFKNSGFNFGRFVSKVALDKNKIEISQKELDEAYALEKFLNPLLVLAPAQPIPVPPGVSPSARLPKNLPSGPEILKNLAQERVAKRKILEKEAPVLAVSLQMVKIEAAKLPPNSPRGGLIPANLVSQFTYDQALLSAAQAKVEGEVELKEVVVSYRRPVLKDEAQTLARNLWLAFQKDANLLLMDFFRNQKVSDGIEVQVTPRILVGEATASASKKEVVPLNSLTQTGFVFDYVYRQERGLSLSFTNWFSNVQKKYRFVWP